MTDSNIGLLIMPALRIDKIGIAAAREEAFRLIDDVSPGGFILFGGRADDVAHLTADLRTRAGRKLLISADLERGAGQQFEGLTRLQTPMAIAACEDADELARAAGRLTAVEALSIGVNVVFAPMCDVNIEPSNPIVNVRTFSNDPKVVGRLAREWILGAQGAGAIACAKHFPGHGGTTTDSHIELPCGPRSEAELRNIHLPPFADAISTGVGSIMVAHMTVPAIDDSGLPATLSHRVVTGLLREEMKFNGLIVTDALIMEGLHADEVEASVVAAKAGCDILLYPASPRKVLERLRDADHFDPTPSIERIKAALSRESPAPWVDPWGGTLPLPSKIASSCVTLLEGNIGNIIRPRYFTIVHDDARLDPRPFIEACTAVGITERPQNAGGNASDTVAAVYSMPGAWRGRSGPSAESVAKVPKGSGVVSFGDPYFLSGIPDAAYKIAAYDDHPLTQKAVVKFLVEKQHARGRLPLR